MVTLTGFADEVSPDLDIQLDVLQSENIAAETFSGFSGPDLFVVASKALKEVLDEIGQEYN